MNVFFAVMAAISFLMMMVQKNYKERIPYACCFIVSMVVLGAMEIIPLFLA